MSVTDPREVVGKEMLGAGAGEMMSLLQAQLLSGAPTEAPGRYKKSQL